MATRSTDGIIPVLVYQILENASEVKVFQDLSEDQIQKIPSQCRQNPIAKIHETKEFKPKGKPFPPVDLSESDLEDEQKIKVQTLLDEYEDVLCKHSRDYGRTDLVKHKIDLTTSDPRLYRVSPKHREILHEKIGDLLEDDLIEPSVSSFAAPALLVRKKTPDNSVQYSLVIDFRQTNIITLKDSHSLPRIDDSLDALIGNAYFSTLDLASGFWQVEMEADDRDKTSFSTGDGLYRWKVMPMGLKNSSATFQRLMELVF